MRRAPAARAAAAGPAGRGAGPATPVRSGLRSSCHSPPTGSCPEGSIERGSVLAWQGARAQRLRRWLHADRDARRGRPARGSRGRAGERRGGRAPRRRDGCRRLRRDRGRDAEAGGAPLARVELRLAHGRAGDRHDDRSRAAGVERGRSRSPPSPPAAIEAGLPGYVDYLDASGTWIGTGAEPLQERPTYAGGPWRRTSPTRTCWCCRWRSSTAGSRPRSLHAPSGRTTPACSGSPRCVRACPDGRVGRDPDRANPPRGRSGRCCSSPSYPWPSSLRCWAPSSVSSTRPRGRWPPSRRRPRCSSGAAPRSWSCTATC